MSTLTKAGRYELREELGRGAMGVVYHGHDPVIGREVAVKTMHLSEAGTGMSRDELVGRFQTEARAAGLLSHPNIVVIYDAGEEAGLFYITMEMVEGRSLQTLLDLRQVFPLPRIMKLMEQVCSALDFAHQHGVVHRDIKPANLVLTTDDTVKITDFGTAKILQFGTTQTAHVMGTPSYMSPEQVKGKPVDGRSDIFALGVILYELLTGEKPFPGQNITTVIYKIINEEPVSPQSLDSSIHPGLSAVITRALAKDPAARFQNCHELMDALKNYHDLLNNEQTIRMAHGYTHHATAGTRASGAPARQSVVPTVVAHPDETGATNRSLPPVAWKQDESSQKRGTVALSVVLLAIIGFAGYRIYPAMVDLWQRSRTSEEPATPPSSSVITMPQANSASQPVATGSDTNASDVPVTPRATATPPPAEKRATVPKAQPQTASPVPAVELPKPASAPIRENIEKGSQKPVASQKPLAPATPSAASVFESQLQSQLAGLPIAGKLKTQVAGNALILSGQLTLAQHRALLNRLHAVPAGVRVIDDIEYKDEGTGSAGSASVGWVWVRSQPRGARIIIDNAETGLRTPARIEIPQGEHAVQLKLRGISSPLKTVTVRAGETSQFDDVLTPE